MENAIKAVDIVFSACPSAVWSCVVTSTSFVVCFLFCFVSFFFVFLCPFLPFGARLAMEETALDDDDDDDDDDDIVGRGRFCSSGSLDQSGALQKKTTSGVVFLLPSSSRLHLFFLNFGFILYQVEQGFRWISWFYWVLPSFFSWFY